MSRNIQLIIFKLIGLLLFALGVILIFYLSWKTNPNIGELPFIPDWLADWTDAARNNSIRTGVPFIGLGILVGAYLGYKKITKLVQWFFSFLVLSIIVFIAEAVQYYIPSRSPDLKDVIWGCAGAGMGLFFPYLLIKVITIIKK